MSRLQTNAIRHLGSVVDNLTLDNAGRVLTPNNPSFFAVKTSSVASGVGVYTGWDVVQLNVGNCFNASSGVFTAPVAGNYEFFSTALASGAGYTNVSMQKNGAYITGSNNRPANAAYDQSTTVIALQLAAGDTVRISDALGSSQGTYSDSNGHTRFGGRLIG